MIVQEPNKYNAPMLHGYEDAALSDIIWAHYPDGGSKLLILLAMAHVSNDDANGPIELSTVDVANKIRLNLRQTYYLLNELKADGLIEYVNEPIGGYGKVNAYRLCLENIVKMHPRRISGKPSRPSISMKVRLAVFDRDGYACKHCGSHKELEIDHVIPLSAGGPHDIENMQTLCRPCNQKKGASV